MEIVERLRASDSDICREAADVIEDLLETLGIWEYANELLNKDENRRKYKEWYRKNHGCDPGNRKIYEDFWALKESVTWVPCVEDLPDHGQRVIVQLKDGTMYFARFVIVEGKNHCWFSVDGGMVPTWGVVAWMPLPQPYKGE